MRPWRRQSLMPQQTLALATLLFLLLNWSVQANPAGQKLAQAAEGQVGVTLSYDPSYQKLAYPNGDVPMARGVCCDVIIRALRGSGLDLQKLVHEDMKAHFGQYPANWGLKKPDSNIDHRRVPNLERWFQRAGWSLPASHVAAEYLPGDIVSCRLGNGLPHIMMISNQKSAAGVPLVVHNIGAGARVEDNLFSFTLVGHYRMPSP